MHRDQIRAVLQGARLALPYLTGRAHTEARDAIDNLFAVLDRRAPVGDAAANYVSLMELRSEVRAAMRSDGMSTPVPVRAVLAERSVVAALRAVARDNWDDAAESEAYLRRLAPDLMFELTVEVGQSTRANFTGRWLVEPRPATGRRERQPDSYCGVAQTSGGSVIVYLADVDERLPGRLDEYDDLAAAAKTLPDHVVRQATAAIVREFNRQAWLREFGRPAPVAAPATATRDRATAWDGTAALRLQVDADEAAAGRRSAVPNRSTG
ncbi:hypothetical protein [Planosporangium mesophilum]|uniref:Uncharacterized protein n=1 Tax=Planosporangium mesophilum TaxID=689768 RepID=A0A8J3T6R2_9ACTN|nr:hypothetical protein [Planosporangium mesophilum]NJC83193.1 hypothetical protein [Planosporangium mesophilum]GII21565.1 hypothetical protein Pme01_11620 [Planosporangium mesophilum]